MTPSINVTTTSTFTRTGESLSNDERGYRYDGFTEVTLSNNYVPVDITACGDSAFAARWLASSLAGAVLPRTRKEVDLGLVAFTLQKSGVKVMARLVGIIGPTELRVVLKHGYLKDGNTMVLPEDAERSLWQSKSDAPAVYELTHDDHGVVRVGRYRCSLPADVIARAEAFYAAARSLCDAL